MSDIGKLKSAQNQVIHAQKDLGISNEIVTSLSNEILLSQVVAESRDMKLAWLSAWRRVFESQIESSTLRKKAPKGFMRILKNLIVLTEDPFVVYQGQKTFIAMMKVEITEEGVTLLEEVLMTSSCSGTLTYYLEMCRDLLSKTNPHCCYFLSKLQSAVNHVGHMYNTGQYRQVSDQFLYQFVSIFYKIAKLLNTYQNEEISRSVCDANLRNISLLLNILFSTDIWNFVKRKLLMTLYYIVQPMSYLLKTRTKTSLHEQSVEKYLLELARIFEQKLSSIGLKGIFLRFGQMSSFVGDEMLEKEDKSVVDRIHLREWCVLSLGMAAILWKDKDSSYHMASDFLLKLDNCVKKGLGIDDSRLLPWLPDVFADQDDMWIDALLLLLELGSSSTDSLELDQHWYFLQFASTIAFDHLVLIDLLTSPETCFLDYLIRYLKYMLKTWPNFVKTVKQFEEAQMDSENSLDSDMVVDNSNNAKEENGDSEMEYESDHEWEHEVNKLSNGNGDSIAQGKSCLSRKGAIHTQFLTHISDGFVSAEGEIQTRAAIEEDSDRSEYRNNCKIANPDNMAYRNVTKHSGLGMIMDTYSDSDTEESSSVTVGATVTDNQELCERAFRDTFSVKNNTTAKQDGTDLPCTQRIGSVLEICSDTELVQMSESSMNGHQNKLQNNSETDFDECDDDNDNDDDDDDDEFVDGNTGSNSDLYYPDVNNDTATVTTEIEDSNLMDRVIGMFIRVMLKLQRMAAHGIIGYDPKPLLKLFNEVEALYVQKEK